MNPNSKQIIVKGLHHRGQNCLGLYFDYDKDLVELAKKLPGCKWSNTHKCWYLENKPTNLKEIFKVFKNKAWVDTSGIFGGKKPPSKTEGNKNSRNEDKTGRAIKTAKVKKPAYPIIKQVPRNLLIS